MRGEGEGEGQQKSVRGVGAETSSEARTILTFATSSSAAHGRQQPSRRRPPPPRAAQPRGSRVIRRGRDVAEERGGRAPVRLAERLVELLLELRLVVDDVRPARIGQYYGWSMQPRGVMRQSRKEECVPRIKKGSAERHERQRALPRSIIRAAHPDARFLHEVVCERRQRLENLVRRRHPPRRAGMLRAVKTTTRERRRALSALRGVARAASAEQCRSIDVG
jgi:hypothetical protein